LIADVMKKLFSGIWYFVRALAKVLSLTLQILVGTIFFLGAAAEITSLVLSQGSIIMENIRNLAAIVANSNIPPLDHAAKPSASAAAKSSASPNCARFEKKLADLHCEDRQNPADRMLCKITVPPTELVCVEYQPRT
jgi:hypothetical protein